MGREVRRVPASWEHPKDDQGNLIPLHDGFAERLAGWNKGNAKWQEGLRDDWNGGWVPIGPEIASKTYEEWDGECPTQSDYMPNWPTEERTHYQMYETCTEGTPISPVMDSPEKLARWLADNRASAFGSQTATYEQWLGMIGEGSSPSMAIIGGVMQTGVALVGEKAFIRDHVWPDVVE